MVRVLTELLPSHPMVKARGFDVPRFPHYGAWVKDPASLLSDEGLDRAIGQAATPAARAELERVRTWSRRVNELISEVVRGVPPFPPLRACLEKMRRSADVIVCSATPTEALVREWEEHDIARYVRAIAGQEMGSKAQHLQRATAGKYARDRVLMIGDAPGDLKAARAAGALFYPVNPGSEGESWQRFHDEVFERFLGGRYAGEYEATLVAQFDRCLPEHPAW